MRDPAVAHMFALKTAHYLGLVEQGIHHQTLFQRLRKVAGQLIAGEPMELRNHIVEDTVPQHLLPPDSEIW